MQNLIVNPDQLTMSSIEVAALTGKRHGDVIRDVRTMLDQLGDDADLRHVVEVRDARGYTAEFKMDRFHTEILVTGYDVKRRAAVIKRWFELETATAKPAAPQLPDFTNPAAAARAWADELEAKQQAMALVEQQKPAVEFVDNYVAASSGSKGFRQVAKLIQANEREFRDFLQAKGIMYRLGGEWMPYQNHIDAGRFEVKAGVAGEHAFNQSKFTAKGVKWVAGLWAQYKLEDSE